MQMWDQHPQLGMWCPLCSSSEFRYPHPKQREGSSSGRGSGTSRSNELGKARPSFQWWDDSRATISRLGCPVHKVFGEIGPGVGGMPRGWVAHSGGVLLGSCHPGFSKGMEHMRSLLWRPAVAR